MTPPGASRGSRSWEHQPYWTFNEVPAGVAGARGAVVQEIRPDYPSQWAAICVVAGKLGIGAPETVRVWVRRAEVDADQRPGLTTDVAAEVARWKRENAEVRRANKILKAAAAFFGAELDRSRSGDRVHQRSQGPAHGPR